MLVIPSDFFADYRLRGARVSGDVISHRVTDRRRGRRRPPDTTRQLDFDWVTPPTLDRFDYVLTNRSRYESEPPGELQTRAAAATPLFKREGETPPRGGCWRPRGWHPGR